MNIPSPGHPPLSSPIDGGMVELLRCNPILQLVLWSQDLARASSD